MIRIDGYCRSTEKCKKGINSAYLAKAVAEYMLPSKRFLFGLYTVAKEGDDGFEFAYYILKRLRMRNFRDVL